MCNSSQKITVILFFKGQYKIIHLLHSFTFRPKVTGNNIRRRHETSKQELAQPATDQITMKIFPKSLRWWTQANGMEQDIVSIVGMKATTRRRIIKWQKCVKSIDNDFHFFPSVIEARCICIRTKLSKNRRQARQRSSKRRELWKNLNLRYLRWSKVFRVCTRTLTSSADVRRNRWNPRKTSSSIKAIESRSVRERNPRKVTIY